MQAPAMRKASVLLAAAALALPRTCLQGRCQQNPGRIGVYARLYEEAASPDKLREAMKLIKSVGH